MNASRRRARILDYLRAAQAPLSATALAQKLSVSRQVIVGDVALLRAGGAAVTATARGYVAERERTGTVGRVACRHGAGDMERELRIMVDNGCTVLDVIVEHPVYGQLTGTLGLASRYDVKEFIRRSEAAQPLSLLTEGAHLHTLSCPDEESFLRVREELRIAGFLLE